MAGNAERGRNHVEHLEDTVNPKAGIPCALHMQMRTEARRKTDTGISYRDLEKHNLS